MDDETITRDDPGSLTIRPFRLRRHPLNELHRHARQRRIGSHHHEERTIPHEQIEETAVQWITKRTAKRHAQQKQRRENPRDDFGIGSTNSG